MTDFIERVQAWWQGGVHAPTVRKVADMVAGGGITIDRFPTRVAGTAFEPGACYFGLRLSGLHLVDARTFATQRLPLCVCLAEFQTDGETRTIPFSIGPEVIRKKLSDAGVTADLGKSAWIELRDITIVRPTPVSGANVSLYAGLFSVPGDDFVETLLNLIGNVGTALSQPAVGPILKVADTVYKSFGEILGFSQVRQVAAALIGNALTERGSGYLLIANTVPEAFDVAKAQVIDGRLHWPQDEGGRAVVEFDHALLALEHYDTITEGTTGLAGALFGKPWADVRLAKTRETANEALGRLRDTISASGEITEDDRLRLLTAYAGAAAKLIEAHWPAPVVDGAVHRSGEGLGLQEKLDWEASQLGSPAFSDDLTVADLLGAASISLTSFNLPHLGATVVTDAMLAGDEEAILKVARSVAIPFGGRSPGLRRASDTVAKAMTPSDAGAP